MKMLFELFHYLFFPSGDHFFKDIDGCGWGLVYKGKMKLFNPSLVGIFRSFRHK